jgi:hypothetical protein
MVIRFIEQLQNVITNNYDSLTELQFPPPKKIILTTENIKSSQPSLAVAWYRLQLPTLDRYY